MRPTIALEVLEKERETFHTMTLVLRPVDGEEVTYRAGQFLTFLFDGLGPTPVRRSYSLSSAPGVDAHLRVTVQKRPNGLVSRYLHERVAPGDILESLPPAGQFTLPEQGAPRQVVLFGGGSGVTPLYGLLKELLHFHPACRVLMIDANRSERHVLFREGLRHYAVGWPERFQLYHYLSSPEAGLADLQRQFAPARLRWGRLSNAIMEELLGTFGAEAPQDTLFYLCGPPALLLKAREVLGFLGYDDRQVHRELFTLVKPFRPAKDHYPDCRVRIRADKVVREFRLEGGQTILEAAEQAGLDLPYSCRSGSCTTCAAQCRRGEAEMFTPDGRFDTRATGGEVLTCVAYPRTEQLLLHFD